jgi:plastocyanin
MTRSIRMLTFQGVTLAAAAFAMSVITFEARAGVPPQTAVVRIGNFTFSQQTLAVRAGTTVTFVNDDDIPHTVVAKNLTFKSKVLDTGDKFSFTFAKAGQFAYFCSLHPHMTGTIIVKA